MKKFFLTLFLSSSILISFSQTYNGGGGAIPDGGPEAIFTINVSGLSPISLDSTFGLESVCINVYHHYVSDLNIRLEAPDGTLVDLSMGNGGSGNNYTNTCFSGNATNSIVNGSPPYSSTYKPQSPLGFVNNGQASNGVWKLRILDTSSPDVGYVINWRIVFGTNPAIAVPFTSSDLPIVIINTNGQAILDEPKITADMGIIYNGPGQRNYVTDPYNNYNNKIGIEFRGSTSQGFPQKPYGLETRDAFGDQLDTALLGMPKEHDWILYPPYNDKSLTRNVLTYDLSRRMGHYAARTKFCELVVNGNYQGIYVLMEKLKRDDHRINISKLDSSDVSGDDLTGGYILKIDKLTGSGGAGWNSNYLAATHPNNQSIYYQYEYPDPTEILVQQEAYIQSYVDSFEYALTNINLSDSVNGYRHFADVNSFIDFFLLNELSKNVDGYRLSTYLFKNKDSKGGKLKAGPVWDFNIAYKNANYCSANVTSGWAYDFGAVCGTDPNQIPFWWEKFMQDPYFTGELKCRWLALRASLLNTSFLNNYIDSIVNLTAEARVRHYDTWPILGVYVWPNPNPIPSTYAGEITALKNYLNARINWLDLAMPGVCSLAQQESLKSNDEFSVYPNPVLDKMTLRFYAEFTAPFQLRMYSTQGQLLFEDAVEVKRIGYQNVEINLSSPAMLPGIYELRMDSKDSHFRKKICIQK